MKRLLSLFDYSGSWSAPYFNSGWDVINWDIKLDSFMNINNLDLAETCLELFEDVDAVMGAVPCTDFTNSGAQYWKRKDLNGQTQKSIELVKRVECIVDLFNPTDPDYDGTFFWVIENPVGRLSKLFPHFGKPFYFDPCDYAGYLHLTNFDHNELDRIRRKEGLNVTRDEVDFVLKCEAYTKKTGLWGDFNRQIEKKKIEPVRVCKQGSPIQRFGGKSDKTKEQRSNTPLGFSYAFFYANN